MVGCYVGLGAFRIARFVGRFVTRMGRARRIRRARPITKAKRIAVTALCDLYSMVSLFGILPILVGVVWDMYVTIPGKFGYMGKGKPVIHIWDAW
jgi:E3 ubiquitin-protein ligase MARCH6